MSETGVLHVFRIQAYYIVEDKAAHPNHCHHLYSSEILSGFRQTFSTNSSLLFSFDRWDTSDLRFISPV